MLALVRKAIVRSLFRLCKAISSTELPDYRGVFTRSTLRVGSDKKAGVIAIPAFVFLRASFSTASFLVKLSFVWQDKQPRLPLVHEHV